MAISHNYPRATAPKPEEYIKQTTTEVQKLARLVTLSAHLSGDSKTPNWLEITNSETLKQLRDTRNENIAAAIEVLKDNRTAAKKDLLQALKEKVNEFAMDFFTKALSTDDPCTRAQLYRYLKTIETNPPMQKTFAGQNGPTFIVSYPVLGTKKDSSTEAASSISCILKWTSQAEVIGHRAFQLFIKIYNTTHIGSGFFVPTLTCFNLKDGFISEEERFYSLSKSEQDEILKNLKKATLNYQIPEPKLPSKNEVVTRLLGQINQNPIAVRIEKVPGKNFSEFANSDDYENLPIETKHSLFRRLGRLAFLDLVLGNTDRLFSIEIETIEFSTYEANLNNLMINVSSDGIAIFLIDNALDETCLQGKSKENYLELLKTTLRDDQSLQKISQSATEGIRSYMNNTSPKAYKCFLKDLQDFGQDYIQVGVNEMTKEFSTLAQQFTESATEAHFKEPDPEILNTIIQRVETVKNLLTKLSETPDRPISTHSPFNGSFSFSSGGSPSNWLIPPEESLRAFFCQIYHHCVGTKEDLLFFSTSSVPEIPKELQKDSILSILDIFEEIKRSTDTEISSEKLKNLKDNIATTLEREFHLSIGKHPSVPGIAPSPLDPTALFTLAHFHNAAQEFGTSPSSLTSPKLQKHQDPTVPPPCPELTGIGKLSIPPPYQPPVTKTTSAAYVPPHIRRLQQKQAEPTAASASGLL